MDIATLDGAAAAINADPLDREVQDIASDHLEANGSSGHWTDVSSSAENLFRACCETKNDCWLIGIFDAAADEAAAAAFRAVEVALGIKGLGLFLEKKGYYVPDGFDAESEPIGAEALVKALNN